MSAFEGPPLDIALRDCGIDTFAVVGIAIEIGIEPTVRHGADLGYSQSLTSRIPRFRTTWTNSRTRNL
jgi:nicotinamidase-related amidase